MEMDQTPFVTSDMDDITALDTNVPVLWDQHWLCACCSKEGRRQIKMQVHMPFTAKCFVVASATESLFLLSLSLYLLIVHTSTTTSLYAGLSIYAILCYAYFVIDSVWNENVFQFLAANIVSILYTAFVTFEAFHRPSGLGEEWRHIRYIVFGGKAAFQLTYFVLGPLAYSSFGYVVYAVAGASEDIQRVYRKFQAFFSALTIDCCAFLFVLIMAAFFLDNVEQPEFIVGCISAALQLALAVVAWNAINRENKNLVAIYCVLAVVQPAYIGYRLWDLYEHTRLLPEHVTYPQFVVTGAVFICARFLLLFCAWWCYKDFGTRLRQKVKQYHRLQSEMDPSPRAWSKGKRQYNALDSPFIYEGR